VHELANHVAQLLVRHGSKDRLRFNATLQDRGRGSPYSKPSRDLTFNLDLRVEA
jgi:hypothetical protein